MPVRVTEKYIHFPIRETGEFRKGSFRTDDIGKKGFSKRVAGKLKGTGKWATQKYLISREEPTSVKQEFIKRGLDEMNRLERASSLSKSRRLV